MITEQNGEVFTSIYLIHDLKDDYVTRCRSLEEITKVFNISSEDSFSLVYGDKPVNGLSLFSILSTKQ